MTREQRTALKELKSDESVDVFPFDKGAGFALIKKEDVIPKMKEQLGDAIVTNIDPTSKLLSRFQRTLAKLRKQDKFDNKLYFQIYPSDAVPPRMYGMLKAHKPQKNFPMRTVVSTVGTVSHGLAGHLVQLIQPTLNKNETRLINSSAFVDEANSWNINEHFTDIMTLL